MTTGLYKAGEPGMSTYRAEWLPGRKQALKNTKVHFVVRVM